MGWASGSELAQNIWNDMKDVLNKEQSHKLRSVLIKRFEENDCDTMYEVEW